MPADQPDLSALIGSRICHDLISPLGAIGNGVELLELSGLARGPELDLIAESVASANARIRYFRIAFGAAAEGQTVAESEIRAVLAQGADSERIRLDWQVPGDQPRGAVKLALLLLLCLDSALPWGGQVQVSQQGGTWQLTGEAERLKLDDGLWQLITGSDTAPALTPAQVHFALVAPELQRQGRVAEVQTGPSTIRIRF